MKFKEDCEGNLYLAQQQTVGDALAQHKSDNHMIHRAGFATVRTQNEGVHAACLAEVIQRHQIAVHVEEIVRVGGIFVHSPLVGIGGVLGKEDVLRLGLVIHRVEGDHLKKPSSNRVNTYIPINQSIERSIRFNPINQSINQIQSNQSIDQSDSIQSINQSINQIQSNQSINRSIDKSRRSKTGYHDIRVVKIYEDTDVSLDLPWLRRAVGTNCGEHLERRPPDCLPCKRHCKR